MAQFLELIKNDSNIDFLGKAKLFFIISGVLIVISLFLIFTKGLNLGIDFSGGTVIQLKYEKPADLNKLRQGIGNLKIGDVSIQNFGNPEEVLIRLGKTRDIPLEELSKTIRAKLAEIDPNNKFIVERVEQVGPQVGSELQYKAMMALLYANIGVLIYVAIRFELIFAIGAILALVHDVIITLGFLSLTSKEFNLTVVAALLALIGYSLNDTIVVFDRIRERIKATANEKINIKDIMNKSINETLSRTIITSLLTFFTVLSLMIFGGEVINPFAFTLVIGIIVGTYSSIGIASGLVYLIKSLRKR
ncbi:protein translocase subunit SecF [Calditerrivibrio nitroreducens]|uniref:Protein translocase subunit SecF n=1 Tax=Calditerrivibrio nitroreducens (strain DSM 19672 / NBRC 101217 / Yu37-1) TaxID=768670 RepID=SECF_CALNY|nr:protein translocase subunit SecF [Calditerrivibrio nitroreducens]E4TJ19.1 RecName: Full=Protein translocase subunit SecF [Calditerrivibrio nitroreducens DSM 19672]ADR19151.1 protein translocase subunit secF [Calditerrivibrio nitroreducens DSM 19672]